MTPIAALLAALCGGEIVASLLAMLGITGRAAVAIRAAGAVAKTAPHVKNVLEGIKSLEARDDLTPNELAACQRMRAQTMQDLGGPME